MKDSAIGVWWFRPSSNVTNFGDELGPEILTRLGYSVKRVIINEAELVTVGSILGLLPAKHNPNLTVWGSGFILPTDSLNAKPKILALRGSLSSKKLGVNPVLGDPGLLVSELWPRSKSPKYRIGVIPHYVDKRGYSWADKIINPTNPVDVVIDEIQSCRTVASSSLHGLIIASSYGIPTMRLYCDKVIGNEFKWIDYMSGFNGRSLSDIQTELVKALDL